jgi:hypothetical protein
MPALAHASAHLTPLLQLTRARAAAAPAPYSPRAADAARRAADAPAPVPLLLPPPARHGQPTAALRPPLATGHRRQRSAPARARPSLRFAPLTARARDREEGRLGWGEDGFEYNGSGPLLLRVGWLALGCWVPIWLHGCRM